MVLFVAGGVGVDIVVCAGVGVVVIVVVVSVGVPMARLMRLLGRWWRWRCRDRYR